MKRAIAFFDLDRTLISWPCVLLVARRLLDQGFVRPTDVVKVMYQGLSILALGPDPARVVQLRQFVAGLNTGWEEKALRRLMAASPEAVAPFVYKHGRQILEAHRAAGHELVIASATACEIVEPIAAMFGVPHSISSIMTVHDGYYTGDVSFYAYGENKAAAMQEFATARGYDLMDCYSYSDSIIDLPMLTAVGHPRAVNPDRALRRVATDSHWPILRFHHTEQEALSTVDAAHQLTNRIGRWLAAVTAVPKTDNAEWILPVRKPIAT